MNCIVTGCAGFVGSHLCERLILDGHTVLGLDDLSTGKLSHLDNLNDHPNFRFHNFDVSKDVINGDNDWMFHLAAKADVVPSIEDPRLYHTTNVTGTMNMLETARRMKTKRFIYAASSSCYGIPDIYPTPEFAQPKPMYPYALTKYLGEQYVMHWHQVYGLSTLSLRLFNVYGPRSRTSGAYGAVFGVFLSQLANGAPVTIVGDGTQSRDFTFVTDVCDAFVKAAESGISGRAFNVGTGQDQSVNFLASCLGVIDRVHIPDRPGEPKKTLADNFQAEEHLKWKANVSFVNGVEIMKQHIADYKSSPLWTVDKIQEATKTWFDYLGEK